MINKYEVLVECFYGKDIQKLKDELSTLENIEVDSVLINPGSKVTPLHIVCQHISLDFVELLLKHGAQCECTHT